MLPLSPPTEETVPQTITPAKPDPSTETWENAPAVDLTSRPRPGMLPPRPRLALVRSLASIRPFFVEMATLPQAERVLKL